MTPNQNGTDLASDVDSDASDDDISVIHFYLFFLNVITILLTNLLFAFCLIKPDTLNIFSNIFINLHDLLLSCCKSG